jgi:hypothetical protein
LRNVYSVLLHGRGRSFFLCLCLFAAAGIAVSCGSAPIDPRTLIPADALIYLETRDLGRTVAAITENPRFAEISAKKPDLRAINGIEMAVAVTGIETSEQQIADENSVLSFQPRFVAVAETRYWNFQVIHFVEEELGLFISEVYGGEALLETSERHGGRYFIWTSKDGRKAFALVLGSLVLFGNDESAIERCLAVRSGEFDAISKNPKITDSDRLAFGYVSPDGVAQIANVAGVALAKSSSEEAEVQSFIARVLPDLLRNTVMDTTWTATAADTGIEDMLIFSTNPEIAAVLNETLVPTGNPDRDLAAFVPSESVSVTRYDMRDPQVAWRSVLLTAQKAAGTVSGEVIGALASSLFEPYGVDDPELFLASVGPTLFTAHFDAEGETAVSIALVKDPARLKRSIAKEIELTKLPEKEGNAEIWRSVDGDVGVAFLDGVAVTGAIESVLKCVRAKQSGENILKSGRFQAFFASNAVAVTAGNDTDSAARIADVIGERTAPNLRLLLPFVTETRLNKRGVERRTISDFGLIGSIIAQLASE